MAPTNNKFKEEKVDEMWRMSFDGAKSLTGKGASIVLTSPTKQTYNFAFRLEFDATNNVVEYEALLIGLEIAKDMGIKILSIKGDSDVVILQVKDRFACKNERLKRYRNIVWDIMLSFDALNIMVIPREENWEADRLAVVASTFQPIDELMDGKGKYEVNFRPSIPDNVTHWQVFDNDKQVLNFIHNVQEFKDCQISYIQEGEEEIEIGEFTENPAPRKFLHWSKSLIGVI